jgi:O-antigen/teichoic acid export membrane protein
LRFGLPLLTLMVFEWLIQSFDKYLLRHYYSFAQVGIYGLGYTLSYFVLSLASMVFGVLYPYYSESYHQKADYKIFQNTGLKYGLLLALPCSAGLWMLRIPIITMLSGQSYVESTNVIPILLIIPLFGMLTVAFNQILMLRNKTHLIGFAHFTAGVCNIGLNLLLIPRYSIYGAALSASLTYVVLFLVTVLFSSQHIHPDFNYIKPLRIGLATVIMVIVISFISPRSAVAKIGTILGGGAVYAGATLILGVYPSQEKQVIMRAGKGILRSLIVSIEKLF